MIQGMVECCNCGHTLPVLHVSLYIFIYTLFYPLWRKISRWSHRGLSLNSSLKKCGYSMQWKTICPLQIMIQILPRTLWIYMNGDICTSYSRKGRYQSGIHSMLWFVFLNICMSLMNLCREKYLKEQIKYFVELWTMRVEVVLIDFSFSCLLCIFFCVLSSWFTYII